MFKGSKNVRSFGRLDYQDLFALVVHFLLHGGPRRHEGVMVRWQRMSQAKPAEPEKGLPGEAEDTAVTAVDVDVSRRDGRSVDLHLPVFLFTGPEDAQDIEALLPQILPDSLALVCFQRLHSNAWYFLKVLDRFRIG